MSESVFITLAKNRRYFKKSVWDQAEMLLLKCQRESMPCKSITSKPLALAFSFQSCIKFDMVPGGALDEASSEGIQNGLTLVLMAENTLLNVIFNLSLSDPIPGMMDIISPTSALKGIRFIVNEEGVIPFSPQMRGLDIPPGVSATVGLTAKRIRHLSPPYTNCSIVNREAKLLMEAIQDKLGNKTPVQGEGMTKGTYSPYICR